MTVTVTPNEYRYLEQTTSVDTKGNQTQSRSTGTGGNIDNVKSGSSNPSYKVQIAKRVDATTDYFTHGLRSHHMWHITAESKVIKPTSGATEYSRTVSNNLGNLPAVNISDKNAVNNRAIAKLYSKLRDASGQFSAMAPLAEARELADTVRFAIGFTERFVRSLADLQRTKSPRRFIRLAQESWLQYSFAIKPTIADIHGLGSSIAAFLGRQDREVSISAAASTDGFGTYDPGVSGTAPLGCSLKLKGTYHYKYQVRYLTVHSFKTLSSNNYGIFDHLGLSPRSIPSTLWELTAFSWMIDYFVNVGQFLEDTFYMPPGDAVYTLKNEKLVVTYECSGHLDVNKDNPNGVVLTSQSCSPSQAVYFSFSRQKLASYPRPSLYVKTRMSGDTGLKRLLNVISLVNLPNPQRVARI